MDVKSDWLPAGYQPLRSLSLSSQVLLCRENASERLLVIKHPRVAESFEREARVLARLSSCAAAPALYFATNGCLGIEYRAGRSLLELAGKLEPAEQRRLATELQSRLRDLHDEQQVAHGDLSPRNILWSPENKNGARVSFLDWEFAQSRSAHAIGSYTQYRGTLGFTGADPLQADPFARDREALAACLRYVSGGEEAPAVVQSRRWPWQWWTKTEGTHP